LLGCPCAGPSGADFSRYTYNLINSSSGFLDHRRLLQGPWQAFERDVARLLLANGFDDVRIVAGTGDRGADVLGVKAGKLWIFQWQATTSTPPPIRCCSRVVEAGKFYGADRLVIASSRPAGESLLREKTRYERLGLTIELAQPERPISYDARDTGIFVASENFASISGGRFISGPSRASGHRSRASRSRDRSR